jgi:methylthioribose-1-phosphate isomerase
VVSQAKQIIDAARPTAVNLTWATEKVVQELQAAAKIGYINTA